MLVARRDPPFHGEGHSAPTDFGRYAQPKAPRIVRFVTVMQMLGSLLAVPVGIASAYSFYRANFSPETTCQTLRSGIIALLDKGVDAGTRRILVRRDVEAFEKTCGTVDPEATAAFKTLLAAAPAAPVTPQKVQRVETPAKEPPRKVETHSQPPVRQVGPAPATAPAVETARREPAVSDTQWLDAVREALVTHKPQSAETQKTKSAPLPAQTSAPASAPSPTPAPAIAPAIAAAPSNPAPASEAKAAPESPTATLQPLPPAISIAPPPQQVDASHPVPPQVIPDTTGTADTEVAKVDDHHRSRIGKWISGIPLLGSIVENGRQ